MNEEQQRKMLDNVIHALDLIRRFMGQGGATEERIRARCDRLDGALA